MSTEPNVITPEQQAKLERFSATLRGMPVEQLFEAFDLARISKAAVDGAGAPYWRAMLVRIGDEMHRQLGPGALQTYARHYQLDESS